MPNQRDLYQQVIREHSLHPRHQGKTNPIHRSFRGDNPYCGDVIELTIQLDQTGAIIEDVKFEAEGCAIAIASADLMAEILKGKSINQALEITENFRQMIKGEFQFASELRKLNVFQGVSQFPLRIKCATLSWHTFRAALMSDLNN